MQLPRTSECQYRNTLSGSWYLPVRSYSCSRLDFSQIIGSGVVSGMNRGHSLPVSSFSCFRSFGLSIFWSFFIMIFLVRTIFKSMYMYHVPARPVDLPVRYFGQLDIFLATYQSRVFWFV
ncbi:hypothetical protein P168DRAFT_61817 [Aspergillus campestris IBT 28561]|uniref:Uncharacterized protein n=1 Tax=Aspergillus campestris (strain IBT 28561) TaxID=1392248 RepID=A0A2I1CUJ9_ASPC2|nr:uncharacterized protein P168DRAFT_61817 [Aspergillus campestris IBT 28561]PKY01306.1 hypothetical protein P168DRAFT_61817 [Aspergillus campestris IBT 28561]